MGLYVEDLLILMFLEVKYFTSFCFVCPSGTMVLSVLAIHNYYLRVRFEYINIKDV